jgi:hypothetical protein
MAGFFKKVGKFLGKVAKVVLPVVGVVTGIGAIAGIAKGVGAIAGVGGILKGGKKVISKVGVSAVNLVTGTTQPERVQLQEQKALTKSITDKFDQVKRLVRVGATLAEARAKVGLTQAEIDTPAEDLIPHNLIVEEPEVVPEVVEQLKKGDIRTASQGCMITTLLILSALAAMAFTIIIL